MLHGQDGGNRGDIVAVISDGGGVVYAETEGKFLPSVVTKLYCSMCPAPFS